MTPPTATSRGASPSALKPVADRYNAMQPDERCNFRREIRYSLHERLARDDKLRRMAQTSNPQVFHESIWPKSFGDAAQTGYVEYNEAYATLFRNKSKYNAIMAALGDALYREFNGNAIEQGMQPVIRS